MDATRLAVMRACAPGAGEVIQGSEGIDSS
jgi:hypothetical protein